MKGLDFFYLGDRTVVTNTRIASTLYRDTYKSTYAGDFNIDIHSTRAIPYLENSKIKLNCFTEKEFFLKKEIERSLNEDIIYIFIKDPYKRLLSSMSHYSFVIAPSKYSNLYKEMNESFKKLIQEDRKYIYTKGYDINKVEELLIKYSKEVFKGLDLVLDKIGINRILQDIHFTQHHLEAYYFTRDAVNNNKLLKVIDVTKPIGKVVNSSFLFNKLVDRYFKEKKVSYFNSYLKQEQSFYNRLKTEYKFFNIDYEQTRIIRTN